MAILSGGGVLRNKKLQKGSTLPFLPSLSYNKPITEYSDVHVLSFFWDLPSTKNRLLSYSSRRESPFIACEEANPKITGVKPPPLSLILKPF